MGGRRSPGELLSPWLDATLDEDRVEALREAGLRAIPEGARTRRQLRAVLDDLTGR